MKWKYTNLFFSFLFGVVLTLAISVKAQEIIEPVDRIIKPEDLKPSITLTMTDRENNEYFQAYWASQILNLIEKKCGR